MSRPKIQYSNITYYAVQRQKLEFPPELEELSEPLEIKTVSQKVKEIHDAIDVTRLPDTFCPPRLTKPFQSDKLYTSPQQGESNE
tara:strand:- start:44 stop:298 length:255 start_codon:yes stop_codon:yes gene_type:complete